MVNCVFFCSLIRSFSVLLITIVWKSVFKCVSVFTTSQLICEELNFRIMYKISQPYFFFPFSSATLQHALLLLLLFVYIYYFFAWAHSSSHTWSARWRSIHAGNGFELTLQKLMWTTMCYRNVRWCDFSFLWQSRTKSFEFWEDVLLLANASSNF